MKSITLLFIRAYRASLAPLLGTCCRFVPSCSNYAEEAFEEKGFFNALAMTLKRISRCHPLNPGGWDPVRLGEAEDGSIPLKNSGRIEHDRKPHEQ